MFGNKSKEYLTISVLLIVFTLCTLLPSAQLATISSFFLVALTGYTVTRHHYAFVAFSCVCIIVSSALLSQDVAATIFTSVESILYGLSLGICFNLKLSGMKTIGILSVFNVAFTLVSLYLSGNAGEILPMINDSVQSIYPMYESVMSQSEFNTLVSPVVTTLTRFIPAFLVIAIFISSSIFFGLFVLVMKLMKSNTHYGCFSDCRSDKSLSVIYFVVLIINMLLPAQSYSSDVVSNIILITSVVFFVYGLAYISFILKNRIANPSKRKLLFTLAAVSPLFLAGIPFMVISFMGAMDGISDFRKKYKQKSEH